MSREGLPRVIVPDLTDQKLTEIEKRAVAATEGPWLHVDDPDNDGWQAVRDMVDHIICDGEGCFLPDDERANIDFIANARTDVPALVAEVRRLTARENELVSALKTWPQDGSVHEPGCLSERVYGEPAQPCDCFTAIARAALALLPSAAAPVPGGHE